MEPEYPRNPNYIAHQRASVSTGYPRRGKRLCRVCGMIHFYEEDLVSCEARAGIDMAYPIMDYVLDHQEK